MVVECTGIGAVGRSAAGRLVSGGIMCLTGITNPDPNLDVDATALNRNMVLHNQVLFGIRERRQAALGTGRRGAGDSGPGVAGAG